MTYETAEPDSTGSWGRWCAAWGSSSSTGSAVSRPWGLAGSVGMERHQENTWGVAGELTSWRSMLSGLCCTTHVAKHASSPSYVEVLPGPQIKRNKHCDSSLFYLVFHCRLVFCYLGAWLLWARMLGIGNNHHSTLTALSSAKKQPHISVSKLFCPFFSLIRRFLGWLD